MKCINMNIIYLIYIFFLKIKIALISYSLSKVSSKTAENNGLMALISPHSSSAGSTPARVGYWWTDDGYQPKQ